jgi:hypothetical protein
LAFLSIISIKMPRHLLLPHNSRHWRLSLTPRDADLGKSPIDTRIEAGLFKIQRNVYLFVTTQPLNQVKRPKALAVRLLRRSLTRA